MKMAEVPRCRLEVVREKRQGASQVTKMVVMVTVEEVHTTGDMAGRMVEMGKISTLAEADMALDWTLILWSWSTLNSLQAEAGMGLWLMVVEAAEASLSMDTRHLISVTELVRAMEEVEVKLLKQT